MRVYLTNVDATSLRKLTRFRVTTPTKGVTRITSGEGQIFDEFKGTIQRVCFKKSPSDVEAYKTRTPTKFD